MPQVFQLRLQPWEKIIFLAASKPVDQNIFSFFIFSLFRKNHRNWRAPKSLARDRPVTEFVLYRSYTHSFLNQKIEHILTHLSPLAAPKLLRVRKNRLWIVMVTVLKVTDF